MNRPKILAHSTSSEKILSDGCLKRGVRAVRNGIPVVCFSEAPLAAMAQIYKTANYNRATGVYDNKEVGSFLTYDPYGLTFSKKIIYRSFGGRTILYMSYEEQKSLTESDWRVSTFDMSYEHAI